MSGCPLCKSKQVNDFCRDQQRNYRQCASCQLVFVGSEQHLSAKEEKACCDLHQNDAADKGYRRFLSRLHQPLSERLPVAANGLDFGCGPGPVLAQMFEESGCNMSVYDLYYAPDDNVLGKEYDFITATEVIEHLASPADELQRLWALLKPGGWLGLMTKLVIDREAFQHWHYKNDLTHISFFSRYTFQWLGKQWGATVEFIGNDVILFNKSS